MCHSHMIIRPEGGGHLPTSPGTSWDVTRHSENRQDRKSRSEEFHFEVKDIILREVRLNPREVRLKRTFISFTSRGKNSQNSRAATPFPSIRYLYESPKIKGWAVMLAINRASTENSNLALKSTEDIRLPEVQNQWLHKEASNPSKFLMLVFLI